MRASAGSKYWIIFVMALGHLLLVGCSGDDLEEAVIGTDAVQSLLCDTYEGIYTGPVVVTDAQGNSATQNGTFSLNDDCGFSFATLDPAGQPLSGAGTASFDGSEMTLSGSGANGVPFSGTGDFSGETDRFDAAVQFQDGTRFSGTLED
jgi:hypothetical protein